MDLFKKFDGCPLPDDIAIRCDDRRMRYEFRFGKRKLSVDQGDITQGAVHPDTVLDDLQYFEQKLSAIARDLGGFQVQQKPPPLDPYPSGTKFRAVSGYVTDGEHMLARLTEPDLLKWSVFQLQMWVFGRASERDRWERQKSFGPAFSDGSIPSIERGSIDLPCRHHLIAEIGQPLPNPIPCYECDNEYSYEGADQLEYGHGYEIFADLYSKNYRRWEYEVEEWPEQLIY